MPPAISLVITCEKRFWKEPCFDMIVIIVIHLDIIYIWHISHIFYTMSAQPGNTSAPHAYSLQSFPPLLSEIFSLLRTRGVRNLQGIVFYLPTNLEHIIPRYGIGWRAFILSDASKTRKLSQRGPTILAMLGRLWPRGIAAASLSRIRVITSPSDCVSNWGSPSINWTWQNWQLCRRM